MTEWQTLGDRSPDTLVDARQQLHWGAQVVASVGLSLVEPEPDGGHTAMTWLPAPGLMIGPFTARNPAFQLGIDPAHLTLVLWDLEGDAIGQLPLAAHTLEQSYDWLTTMVSLLMEEQSLEVERPSHGPPDHPIGHGDPFSWNDPDSFAELGRWFQNADIALNEELGETGDASPVQCWPQHLRIATRASSAFCMSSMRNLPWYSSDNCSSTECLPSKTLESVIRSCMKRDSLF